MSEKEKSARITTKIDMPKLMNMLQLFGKIFDALNIYGTSHPRTSFSINQAYDTLEKYLMFNKKLNLHITKGALWVNEHKIDTTSRFVKIVETLLIQMQISNFTIREGISREEYEQLMEQIGMRQTDAFESNLQNKIFKHVSSSSSSYQEVGPGQRVIDDTTIILPRRGNQVIDLDEEAFDMGLDQEVPKADSAQTAQQDNAEATQVSEILAFINGRPTEPPPEALMDTLSDADKLAGLIVEAAAIRQKSQPLDSGETLADLVIGCLRRTYDGLHSMPVGNSVKGKKSIRKALLLLEKSILDKLHDVMLKADSSVDQSIGEAIDTLTNSLDDEIIASQATIIVPPSEESANSAAATSAGTARTASSASETQITPPIAFSQPHEFGRSWKRLEVRSKPTKAAPAKSAPPHVASESKAGPVEEDPFAATERIQESFKALAKILDTFDKLMNAAQPDSREVIRMIADVENRIDQSANETEKLIDKLESTLQRERQQQLRNGTWETTAHSCNAVLGGITKVVLELMQPLTVINSCHAMLLSGNVGELTLEQRNLLVMADTSGDQLNELLNKLMRMIEKHGKLPVQELSQGEKQAFSF